MAASLISHPFRLGPDGSIATRQQGSDEYNAEQIALLCLTHPGERPLVPTFGVDDPTFNEFVTQSLAEQIEAFGPPVTLTKIEAKFVTATSQKVSVVFDNVAVEFN